MDTYQADMTKEADDKPPTTVPFVSREDRERETLTTFDRLIELVAETATRVLLSEAQDATGKSEEQRDKG